MVCVCVRVAAYLPEDRPHGVIVFACLHRSLVDRRAGLEVDVVHKHRPVVATNRQQIRVLCSMRHTHTHTHTIHHSLASRDFLFYFSTFSTLRLKFKNQADRYKA